MPCPSFLSLSGCDMAGAMELGKGKREKERR